MQNCGAPFKLFGLRALLGSLADDDEEVLRQHERDSLPLVAKFLLLVIQEMSKIYVEQLEKKQSEGYQLYQKETPPTISLKRAVLFIFLCLRVAVTWPSSLTIMLLLCLSPIPRINVATQ